MGSKWRKAKLALGLNLCLYVPPTSDGPSRGINDAVSPSSSSTGDKSKTCAICLSTMKPGQGHAIFTAECSHSFHFHCVTSNVKHGNQICPVCRAKWKEIPLHKPGSDTPKERPRINPVGLARDDAWMTVVRRLPSPRLDPRRQIPPLFHSSEPTNFDDDEALDDLAEINGKSTISADIGSHRSGTLEVNIYPEISSVPKSASHDNFTILIHLKAPLTGERQNQLLPVSQNSRAPVDLVTVLDVSGSMQGTKLALLKRAMGFVIQNLGPSDRLSVIAFSSAARRIFTLRRMTDTGRQEALHAINSLVSNGGTNIAEGLRKGAKVIVDRKWKNPVASIVLLSDGQDTYTVNSPSGAHPLADYRSLLPVSIHQNGDTSNQIPVHAFGFGMDHDSVSMHSISEMSGGTFSFIEAEGVIQDAFAQCIGGLLSVVVQGLRVEVECVNQRLRLGSIKAGSYKTSVTADARMGLIDVGDLYAEEERNFLVTINVPVDQFNEETSLLKVRCFYKDPITKESVTLEEGNEVKIQRPEIAEQQPVMSIEVDRQRNRLRAAEAMGEARVAADKGNLSGAVSILESCRKTLSETVSARACDRLCVALDAELKEMQDRMANRHVYESSGRAYVLSGLSSHSWQRATARGDSTDSASLVHAYQTPAMFDMVTRSQTMVLSDPPPQRQRKLRQALSFPARPHGR